MDIVQRTRADLDLAKVDWAGLAEVTDAEIERAIDADPDVAPCSPMMNWRARGVFSHRRCPMTCAP